MNDSDALGLKSNDSRTDTQPTSCPTCGTTITAISTRGPGDHRANPCGHNVSAAYLDTPRVATDGGYDPCPSCGADPETCYRCQSCGYDLTGRTTSGREATQR